MLPTDDPWSMVASFALEEDGQVRFTVLSRLGERVRFDPGFLETTAICSNVLASASLAVNILGYKPFL